ncbi:MAG: gliding motility-associated C-terminal domain-containing protein [Bacteroidota bacterium]
MKILRTILTLLLFLTITTAWTQDTPMHEWGHTTPYHNGAGVFWPHFKSTTDPDGNVYVAGEFRYEFDADPGPGVTTLTAVNDNYHEVYVSKYNADGIFQWARKWSQPPYEYYPGSLIVDNDGNLFVNIFIQTAFSTHQTLIVKLDASGNELWQKKINTNGWGGRGIALDPLGNVIIAGGFSATVDFDPNAGVQNVVGNDDLFVWKLDINGNLMWVKTMPGTGTVQPCAIATDPTNNILVTGHFSGGPTDFDPGSGTTTLTPAGSSDIFILKLEPDGDLTWAKQIGGSGIDYAYDIASNTSGDIFIAGSFTETVDFDPGVGTSVATSLPTTKRDGYLLRLNPDGTYKWAWQFGSTDDDDARGVSFDTDGNILLAGQFQGTVDFDPGSGVTNLSGGGGFFLKLKDNYELFWARELGTMTTSLRSDNNGMITVVGQHVAGTIDTDFGVCKNEIYPNTGWQGIYFVKYYFGTEQQITLSSVSPTSGPVGTTVIINGTNFGTRPDDIQILFNNRPATITAITPTQITTFVPPTATTGFLTVKYKCFPTLYAPGTGTFTVGTSSSPTITSFNPTSGETGTTVTINGTNFSTTPGNNIVKFNGTTAVVTASTATSITTTVPAGATTGLITVTVGGLTATSATNFVVNGAISITAQPVGETVCQGETVFLFVTAAGANNLTFQWEFSTDGVSSYTEINDAVSNELEVNTSDLSAAGFYRCVVNGESAPTVTSDPAELLINPRPDAPGVTPASRCGTGTLTLSASGAANGEFIWYSSASGSTEISGEVNASFTTPVLSETKTYYVSIGGALCNSERIAVVATVITSGCAPEIQSSPLTTTPGGTIVMDLKPLITTPGTLDVNSIKITSGLSSGANAMIEDGVLTITYSGSPFTGVESITVQACNTNGNCSEQDFEVRVVGELTVYNAVSPNGDGKNDKFIIEFIDLLPGTKSNKVSIFNRWGDEVFSVENYDNINRVFIGVRNDGSPVSSGTYYYKAFLPDQNKTLTGYLQVKR